MKLKSLLNLCILMITHSVYSQTVDFSFSTSNSLYCNPQTVTFVQNSTGGPTSFIWDFGDGQSGVNGTETVIYLSTGTFTVTLTAIYATNAISTSKIITINPSPSLTLGANTNYLCQPGNINFTAAGSNYITSYQWDFGDGSALQTTNTNTLTHNYTAYGSYTAMVKGVTAFGCSVTSSYDVQVTKFSITGGISPTSGCIPVNATLSVTTNLPPGDSPQNYLWNFGDGSPTFSGASNSIGHIYSITTPITTANVFITSVQGCTNQLDFSKVAYGTPPFNTIAQTQSLKDTFCGSETIAFIGKAVNANSYSWDFGDGTALTVTDTLAYHKYSQLGNFKVTVTPFFNGCQGNKASINIFIEGVIASFTYSNTCSNKNIYAFNNLSIGNVSHFEWLFSETPALKDSVNYNVSHTFPLIGNYTASLFVKDNITGCTDVFSSPIFNALPRFSSTTPAVCKDSLITYRVSNSYPSRGGFFYDFFVDGIQINTAADSVLNFNPTTHGTFKEYVVIGDFNPGTCSDTLYLPVPTRVRGPIAAFTSADRTCANKSVQFTNTSTTFFANENIVKWKWDYSDNKFDVTKNPPPHSFPSNGIFNVILLATDLNGCGSLANKYVYIDPVPQITVFPAIDTICQNKDSATLRAYTIDTLLWMPATNINCTTCDTVKVYPQQTTSYIAQATNVYGCTSFDTTLVKVYAPFQVKVFPSDTSVCPRQPVRFNLDTPGLITWSPGAFLSGTSIQNPVAIPDSSVTYKIVVKDSVGCFADTATSILKVFPVPVVDAGPDKTLDYNTIFTLSPTYSSGSASYLWSPPGNLNCTNCAVPTGTAVNSITYTIKVTSKDGCIAKDDIKIILNCKSANLLMPNAFTPDKNGLNDYFYPITRGFSIIKTFVIYNRFGNKVFERKDFAPNISTLGWDGNVKGNATGSNSAVFVWYIEAQCDLGQTVKSQGTVLLIR